MVKRMQIKSNTLGKLQKIKNGNVFESPLIFIRELLQNSQRSKASNVDFTVIDGQFICRDDGCGCKNPENVFTLDLSEWESTQEGYGIGFWSCLCIPDVSQISVRSKNWTCTFDAQKLFETGDLSVNKEKTDEISGFEVIINSPYFDDAYSEIEKYLYDVAKFLPMIVSLNELKLPKQDLFGSFKPDEMWKMYDNRIFRAKLAVTTSYYKDIKLYYDKRFVCNITHFDYVEGVIEIKPGKITLKEPDRTSYTRDAKYYSFVEKVEECIKDLYKDYVKQYGVDNEDMLRPIEFYLSVQDYEKYLSFDDDMLDITENKPKKITSTDKKEVTPSNHVEKKDILCNINVENHQFENQVTVQNLRPVACKAASPSVSKESSFKERIKGMKKAVWVRRSEYSMYQDFIQKAKYKGLKVIVSKNLLYDCVLSKYGILHISELEEAFTETYIKTDICLKTSKEEAFISLLKPICKKYHLPEDCFLIANLSIESSFVVKGEVVFKRKIKNKRDDIQIYGVTDGRHIYLDRTALSLNRFHIKRDNFGIWELKAVVNAVNVIAHELAHYLDGTTDNTPEHYASEIRRQQEILKLYI